MLNNKTIELLKAPFDESTIQTYAKYKNTDGEDVVLVGVKPQYIVERLNEAFGHDGWDLEIKQVGEAANEKSVWAWVRLSIYQRDENGIRQLLSFREQYGNNSKNKYSEIGDVYKGAVTNGLDKCASLYDIAHEVYKGKVSEPEKILTEDEKLEAAFTKLKSVCSEVEIGKDTFPALTKNVLGKELTAVKAKKALKLEDVEKLIAHVEEKGSPF